MQRLEYSQFENRLGELSCRNKVLFIDACHSGELDKDEVQITSNQEKTTGNIVFRKVGNGSRWVAMPR